MSTLGGVVDTAEIKLSSLERTLRIDSEFFQKTHLTCQSRLIKLKAEPLNKVGVVSDGNHFSISEYFQDDGVPYYRGQDITGHFFVEQSSPAFINENVFNLPHLIRSHLKKGDVLLSIVGTIGESSLVTTDRKATCSCKLAILRPRSIPAEYLATFLKCSYGRSQIDRFTRGAVQMGLLLEDFDQILVARFSGRFESATSEIVNQARILIEKSRLAYQQAVMELLSALGLSDWQPVDPIGYLRKASEAMKAERLDAEYFHPKYDSVITAMNQKLGKYKLIPIKEFSQPLKYGCSEELTYTASGRPFLRIADLENKRFEMGSTLHVSSEHVFRESELVKKGDVLVSRSGTLGVGVPITEEFEGASYGSYFIRVRSNNDIHPEYLSLFINSLGGQLQVEQKNTGGVQTNLTIPAIESICVPVGDYKWQMKFVNLVEPSLAARKQAKALLEKAKRAVEIAIEQNEKTALVFLANGKHS